MPRRSPHAASRTAVASFLVAFALLGYLSAHAIAYQLAGVTAEDGHHHVHGYFSWLELTAGIGATAGLIGSIVLAFRGAPLAPFLHPAERSVALRRAVACGGLLPAGVFVVAEFVERWIAGAPLPPEGDLLLLGTFAQVVVGLLAWTLARRCIRMVDTLVAWLRAAWHRRRFPAQSSPRPRPVDGPPVRGVMARSLAGRAPPRHAMLPR
jgi:hypothetical protein